MTRSKYRMIIESSISSAPALGLSVKMGAIARRRVDCTMVNSPSAARDFPLSFLSDVGTSVRDIPLCLVFFVFALWSVAAESCFRFLDEVEDIRVEFPTHPFSFRSARAGLESLVMVSQSRRHCRVGKVVDDVCRRHRKSSSRF